MSLDNSTGFDGNRGFTHGNKIIIDEIQEIEEEIQERVIITKKTIQPSVNNVPSFKIPNKDVISLVALGAFFLFMAIRK